MLIAVKILKPRLVIPYLAAQVRLFPKKDNWYQFQLLMLFTTASFFVIFIITVYFPDDVGNFIFEILKISKAQVDKIEEDWGHEGYIFSELDLYYSNDVLIPVLRLGGFSMNVLCFFLFCFELWTLRVSFQVGSSFLSRSKSLLPSVIIIYWMCLMLEKEQIVSLH